MIFPARNLHLEGIFHGYVSHNQMVKSMGFFSHSSTIFPVVELGSAQAEPRGSTSSEVETTNAVW